MSAERAGLGRVRMRRLANTGLLRLKPSFEIEYTAPGDDAPTWTQTTSTPYTVLKPLIGWDEAALLEQAATKGWTAGQTGAWQVAFSRG